MTVPVFPMVILLGAPSLVPFLLHLPALAAAAGSWCGVLGADSGVLGAGSERGSAGGRRRRRRELGVCGLWVTEGGGSCGPG